MAFPSGWKWIAKLVVDHTKVTADQTNFTVLINKNNCPTLAMDADGGKPAVDGGGDLVFTTDPRGVNRIPCDVQQFQIDNNPANALVEVFVQLPSVSASVDTAFYMWWGNNSASQPARNAAFGMEATWDSNYKGVFHLTESWNTSAGTFKDATSSVAHGTGSAVAGSPTMSSVTAAWGGGRAINCSNAALPTIAWKISCPGGAPLNYNVRGSTISMWVNLTGQNGWCIAKGTNAARNWGLRGLGRDNATGFQFWNRAGGDNVLLGNSAINTSTWYYLVATVAADGSLAFYKNGAASGTQAAGSVASENGTDPVLIGSGAGDGSAVTESWKGAIDEVRLSNSVRSATSISTMYNSMNSPGTFITFEGVSNAHGNDFLNFF